MAEDFELNCRLISRAELIKRRIGMRPGTVCLAARQDAQRSLAAVKEMPKTRGEAYLKFAKRYLSQRQCCSHFDSFFGRPFLGRPFICRLVGRHSGADQHSSRSSIGRKLWPLRRRGRAAGFSGLAVAD